MGCNLWRTSRRACLWIAASDLRMIARAVLTLPGSNAYFKTTATSCTTTSPIEVFIVVAYCTIGIKILNSFRVKLGNVHISNVDSYSTHLHIVQCYMFLCPKIVLGMFPVPRTLSAPCSRPRTSWSSFQNYSMHSMYSLLDG